MILTEASSRAALITAVACPTKAANALTVPSIEVIFFKRSGGVRTPQRVSLGTLACAASPAGERPTLYFEHGYD